MPVLNLAASLNYQLCRQGITCSGALFRVVPHPEPRKICRILCEIPESVNLIRFRKPRQPAAYHPIEGIKGDRESFIQTSITRWSATADADGLRDGHASRGKSDQEFSCCIHLIEQ